MKINLSKILFMFTFMIGLLISISSNNWILIWCGLEISMMSFIPMMTSNLIITSESTIKYFIVQSVSSSLLMLGMLIMIMKGEYNYDYLVKSSLLIKMGVAPFHNWVLTVIEGMTPQIMFIMLTINKVAPITIMSYMLSSMILLICLNALMASIMSINQNSVKKLLTYSSIMNMSFVLIIIKLNLMWTMYFFLYSTLLLMMTVLMINFKIIYMNQIIMTNNKMSSNILIWMIMLSMGGMPPLVGFSIKYMALQAMINTKMYLTLSIMILASLTMMMVYLRLTFISMMNSSLSLKLVSYNMKYSSTMMLIMNISLIPMILLMKLLN
uniref:NADH dehydrogenase subunit 2 n=1 Tax=Limassolla lingchuanensis TaxID=2704520 RepID=UPI0013E928EF|nr:NADH dehydrogenase subunit 2 [Limassolla lingchuanensis]QHR79706.1 NADH dehydrogenase subunit 2 [Limassolla lingchuanensis]